MLKENIILLEMLNAEPARPKSYSLSTAENRHEAPPSHRISLQREHDMVDYLAFLSSISEDPDDVTAVCLEEISHRNACIVAVASNTGRLENLVSGFSKLAEVLKSATSLCRFDGVRDMNWCGSFPDQQLSRAPKNYDA